MPGDMTRNVQAALFTRSHALPHTL